MRVLLLLLPLLLLAGGDFETILQQAKKEKKILIIEATSSQCRYCKWMEETTLSDPKVKEALRGFYLYRVDVSKEALPMGLQWDMTPTFFFIKDGRVIKKIPGAWKRDDFLQILKEVQR